MKFNIYDRQEARVDDLMAPFGLKMTIFLVKIILLAVETISMGFTL